VDDANYYNSTYGDEFKNLPGERAQILNKLGRADNVIIGNDPNSYLS
jgi:hypothetical protein